jgi:hypothetical protein
VNTAVAGFFISFSFFYSVIPAKAGIHFELKDIEPIKQSQNRMDPRLREDDGGGFIGVNLRLSAVK